MEKLKVLIADGNITCRKAIAEAVDRTGLGAVQHIASTGSIAVEWLKQDIVDVVLIDVSILTNEGLGILKTIKKEYKAVEVIITSTQEPVNAAVTLEALKLGAMDFILKPPDICGERGVESIKSYLHTLFAQIKIRRYSSGVPDTGRYEAAAERDTDVKAAASVQAKRSSARKLSWGAVDLVVIAASTGGPYALETVLCGLPAGFSKPVLVVQHMPPDFTNILAQALDKKSGLKVSEARDSDPVREGHAIVAPGGLHMTVESSDASGKVLKLLDTPFVNGVKPSADVLFHSVAKAYEGRNILAVILTGMGNDGTQGIAEIRKRCGCYCITQSEKTCVVYGMPRSVYEAGLSDETADIGMIAERIVQIVEAGERNK